MRNENPTNKALYEEYEPASSEQNDLLRERLPRATAKDFLSTVAGFWWPRYYCRCLILQYDFADTMAKELLLRRIRQRNGLYSALPDVPAAQIAWAERLFGSGADVSTFHEIPSFGPSFLSLWADAKKRGLSHKEAAESIREWGTYRSSARDRYYDRKRKKQPLVSPEVAKRLTQVTAWRKTGDLSVPWVAEVAAHRWQIRLNDFPDELMYTLLIDGEEAGDFNDWPQAWDRGQKVKAASVVAYTAPAKSIPANWLRRYQSGECEPVWRELVSLGPDVRTEPYHKAASSVAQETMRRAAHNVGLLIEKLRQLDYRFYSEQYLRMPCSAQDRKMVDGWARKGFQIPLSMRAFMQEVEWVTLVGSHPQLNPVDDKGEVPYVTDPLEVVGRGEKTLEDSYEEWAANSPKEREPVDWQVGTDAKDKAFLLMNCQVDFNYTMQLPNAVADAALEGRKFRMMFVEYLRLSFQWGGFPGWEKYKKRPEKELAFLKEGLLPI